MVLNIYPRLNSTAQYVLRTPYRIRAEITTEYHPICLLADQHGILINTFGEFLIVRGREGEMERKP